MPSNADGFVESLTHVEKQLFPIFSSAFGDEGHSKPKGKISEGIVISGPSSSVARMPCNLSMKKATAGGVLCKPPSITSGKQHVSVQDIHKTILAKTSTKAKKQLQPALPPPQPSVGQTTSFKQMLPPTFPAEPRNRQKIQKRLQQPSFRTPQKADDKALRTITTTVLSSFNSLPTLSGGERTVVPFHERHADFSAYQSQPEPRIFRGLEVSPEKRDKGKNLKPKR